MSRRAKRQRPKRLTQPRYDPERYTDPRYYEWLNRSVPKHFWEDRANHHRYIQWLGSILNIRKPEDWYQVNRKHFQRNRGGRLFYYYDGVCDLFMSLFPEYDWKPWLFDRPPIGFWHQFENRRRYMQWLGKKLGFKKVEDWYTVSHQALLDNKGAGLALICWNSSIIAGVKECFPNHPWLDWKFAHAPHGFWQQDANCRRYMKWLGQELGLQRSSDWYHVVNEDFNQNYGQAFLVCRRLSVPQAVMRFGPRYDFKEWLFDVTPGDFWKKRANRRRYMQWLGKRLKYKVPEDWYALTFEDLAHNHGRGLLVLFHKSPVAIVKDYYPRRQWHEWKFSRVPAGFWENRENRHRFLDWLGKQLGYRQPSDWLQIRREDLRPYAKALMIGFDSYVEIFRDYLPAKVWKRMNARVNKPALTERQILSWADAHHRRTGAWPKMSSGKIRGQQLTWSAVNQALEKGNRGLTGKKTLAQLLKQRKRV